MSVVPAAPAAKSHVGEDPEYTIERGVGAPSATSVLITESEVALGSSAALSLPHTRITHRLSDATHVVAANLRWVFLTPAARPRRVRRHYPPRADSYFEHGLMAREMHRL
jgi:hypothetical protein